MRWNFHVFVALFVCLGLPAQALSDPSEPVVSSMVVLDLGCDSHIPEFTSWPPVPTPYYSDSALYFSPPRMDDEGRCQAKSLAEAGDGSWLAAFNPLRWSAFQGDPVDRVFHQVDITNYTSEPVRVVSSFAMVKKGDSQRRVFHRAIADLDKYGMPASKKRILFTMRPQSRDRIESAIGEGNLSVGLSISGPTVSGSIRGTYQVQPRQTNYLFSILGRDRSMTE